MRKSFTFQFGQTLIETLAALFILVMGISAAVGLAVYAFNSSTTVTKEIIGAGLAREGIEAVKNMRDTNWLNQTSINTNCYDYASSTAFDAKCYSGWLNQTFCLDPTSNNGNCNGSATTMNYALALNDASGNAGSLWNLLRQFNTSNYGMTFDPNDFAGSGFYVQDGLTPCGGGNNPSDYCRKIIITKDTSAPYNQNVGPLLFVQSQVWWADKHCPRSVDWPGPGHCSVELDSYLTNWKNY